MSREADPTAPTRGTTWRRTRAVGAMLAAAAAGVMLANIVADPRPVDLSALRFSPLATEAGYEGLPAWSSDGQTIAYAAEVNGTLQIFTRRLVVAGVRRSGDPRAVRLQASVLVARRETHLLHVAGKGPGEHLVGRRRGRHTAGRDRERNSRGRSPDGRTLAFLRDEQHADIVGAVGSLAVRAVLRPARSSSPAEAAAVRYEGSPISRFVEGTLSFSPDGTKLLLSAVPRTINLRAGRRGWQLWILPLPGGQAYRRLQWWSRCGAPGHQLHLVARQSAHRARFELDRDPRLGPLAGGSRT